jgi:hypothetical protein
LHHEKAWTEGFHAAGNDDSAAIIGTLCAFALTSMNEHIKRTKLRNTAAALAADIRQARWMARIQSVRSTIVFDTDQQAYFISGSQNATLPEGIRFGVDPAVSGKPSDPYSAPP